MSVKTLNVGLVGFGLSGRYFHAPFLSENPVFKIKKVMERSKNEAQEFDSTIENARSLEELLDDDAIDLVFICTPNDTHYDYAKQALLKGKHVVIEKPFANTEVEAQELVTLAKEKGLILTAYQNRRWDSDFLTLKKIIEEGKIGDVVEFESRYDRYRPAIQSGTWKEQSGLGYGNLYNLGPHLLDQALVLFGEPLSITADIRTVRPESAIDDYFSITLTYADKLVTVKSSLLIYQNFTRYTVHGSKGSFVKGGLDVQEETLRKDVLPTGEEWGLEPEDRWGTLYSDDFTGIVKSELGNYHPFYQNVYDAIVEGKELMVKPEEILRTTRAIDLALKSNEEKRAVNFR